MHLLKNTPAERMVVSRYPALKQSIFGATRPLADDQAYDGSPLARTGHHNDCFLSSANDVGTYNRGGQDMPNEIACPHAETRHTLFGGESRVPHERSERDSALFELEHLHAGYLNAADLAAGEASWALHLPDTSERLDADPRFSYRLATAWPVTR